MARSKLAVVTGVCSGAGPATAVQFAQGGWKVLGCVRDAKKAKAAVLKTLCGFMPAGPVDGIFGCTFGLG